MTELFETGLAGEEHIPDHARAVLIIVHGLGEHRGRYRAVTERLNATSIACFTYDQRGHGESPGSRTTIGDFAEFTNDLLTVVKAISVRYPAWPMFLWGHSLGSIVVLSYVLQYPDAIRGGITTGCPLSALPHAVGTFSNALSKLSALLPEIRVGSRLNSALLSHEERVQSAYQHDPLVTHSVTLELIFEMSRTIKRLKRNAHEIQTPWLAIHGSEDEIAPPKGSRFLIDALGSSDKKLEIVENARHEIHNEKTEQREIFLRLISDWISERA